MLNRRSNIVDVKFGHLYVKLITDDDLVLITIDAAEAARQ